MLYEALFSTLTYETHERVEKQHFEKRAIAEALHSHARALTPQEPRKCFKPFASEPLCGEPHVESSTANERQPHAEPPTSPASRPSLRRSRRGFALAKPGVGRKMAIHREVPMPVTSGCRAVTAAAASGCRAAIEHRESWQPPTSG